MWKRSIEMHQLQKSKNEQEKKKSAEEQPKTINKYTLEDNMRISMNGIEMFGCTFYRLPHKDGIEHKLAARIELERERQ